jgi:hypothetical protein
MKIGPIFPFSIAFLAVLLAFVLYAEFLFFLGFPDGFMSELDYAEAPLVATFNWISLLAGVWFVFLGVMARRRNVNKPFVVSCILYSILILACFMLDQYFRSYMADSAGG